MRGQKEEEEGRRKRKEILGLGRGGGGGGCHSHGSVLPIRVHQLLKLSLNGVLHHIHVCTPKWRQTCKTYPYMAYFKDIV